MLRCAGFAEVRLAPGETPGCQTLELKGTPGPVADLAAVGSFPPRGSSAAASVSGATVRIVISEGSTMIGTGDCVGGSSGCKV